MPITAKWGGVCVKCNSRFEPGESITWDGDTKKSSHFQCPENPVPAAEEWRWGRDSSDLGWVVKGTPGKSVPIEVTVTKKDGTSQRLTLIEEVEPGSYKSEDRKGNRKNAKRNTQSDLFESELRSNNRQRGYAPSVEGGNRRASTVGNSGCVCGSTCCGGGQRCRCGGGCECRGGEAYGCY